MIEIVAEIGINHNGDIQTARAMASIAFDCGCNLVKFQKREPELCVPPEQRDVMRSTPWGEMTYLEYKKRIEFGAEEYDQIDQMFAGHWFVSVWDVPSVYFANRYDCPYIKIPSAKLTDKALVAAAVGTGKPIILSTGMSTRSEIINACTGIPRGQLTLMHAVSAYPLADNKANLRKIATLKTAGHPVGYSDHTRGIHIPTAAATMGVCMIEKHFTLDRTMWGTDQSASIEPHGMAKLVRNVRAVESAMGTGNMEVDECEQDAKKKLRG